MWARGVERASPRDVSAPFDLSRIAQDRQEYLTGKKALKEITDEQYCTDSFLVPHRVKRDRSLKAQALSNAIRNILSSRGGKKAFPRPPKNWDKVETHSKQRAAEILGVTRRTIYNYEKRGWLKTTDNGRITTESMQAFLEDRSSHSP